MSLKTRIIVLLVVVVAIFAAADTMVQRTVMKGRFADLEESLALGELGQARDDLQSEVDEVEFVCRNLRSNRSLMDVLPGSSPDDGKAVFDPLAVHALDLVYLCDQHGRVLFGRIEEGGSSQPIRLRDFPGESLSPTHPLVEDVSTSGLMMTEHGPLLVSAMPVGLEREAGAQRARLIVGRFLTQQRMSRVGERMERAVRFLPVEGLEADLREMSDRIAFSGQAIVEESEQSGSLLLYDVVSDIRGLPILLVELAVPRDVLARGLVSAKEMVLSTVGIALLLLMALTLLLQKLVIGPVQRVTDHATTIQLTGDTSARLELDREDEIGVLANELDRMVEELDKNKKEKVELARMAGISEVATGILHNVGNVLNSVNVSADVAERCLKNMPTEDFERLLQVLEEHEDDLAGFLKTDPRGKHLVPLLKELFEVIRGSSENALSELDLLRLNVEHINDLVDSQQSYAGRSTGMEWTSVSEQIEMALRVCAENREDFAGIEVVHEIGVLPRIQLDRHKTLQILVNLMLNACEALSKSEVSPRVLTVRAGEDGAGNVAIEVVDNGVGIAKDDLLRVFLPGFTTSGASQGLGLHMSATNAMEMGGKLAVRSDGPGYGATFVLTLPLERRAAQAA